MKPNRFAIVRSDGRSNAQVIVDLVKNDQAGTEYTYEQLAFALGAQSNRRYTTRDVQRIVIEANRKLLKQHCRVLHNVRNSGYRLAPGSYHLTLAHERHAKADRQLQFGYQLLHHVRWDELDANQRMAHEAQLLISSAIYQQVRALERRQRSVEEALRKIKSGNSE